MTQATNNEVPAIPQSEVTTDEWGNPTNTSSTSTKPKAKVLCWLNVSVVQADGTLYKLPVGIPLREGNRREQALVEALRANPDIELNCKASAVFTDGSVAEKPIVIKL